MAWYTPELAMAFVATTHFVYRSKSQATTTKRQGTGSHPLAVKFGGWLKSWIKITSEWVGNQVLELKAKRKSKWYRNTPIRLFPQAASSRKNISRKLLGLQLLIMAMAAQAGHKHQAQAMHFDTDSNAILIDNHCSSSLSGNKSASSQRSAELFKA